VCALAVSLGGAGCLAHASDVVEVRQELPGDLLEVIRAYTSRNPIGMGDTLEVQSFVINYGGVPRTVQSNHCWLEMQSKTLTFGAMRLHCTPAGSHEVTIPPGDTLYEYHWSPVSGLRRGTDPTTVWVRHLVDPVVWIPVRLRVREPGKTRQARVGLGSVWP
jgi:hypothetical protein